MTAFAFSALSLLSIQSSYAEVFLGATPLARHHTDVDSLNIYKCGLKEIKLRADLRPADIDHVFVEYGNGMPDELEVRNRIRRGGETRWINLNGLGDRCVKRIVIIGDSEGRGGKQSVISVFGR